MRPMSARKSASTPSRTAPRQDSSRRKGSTAVRGLSLRGDVLWSLLALAVGAIVLPPLVWMTGLIVIGPYANGGLWAMITDSLAALQQGSKAAWITLLAPLALVVIWRTTLRLARRR